MDQNRSLRHRTAILPVRNAGKKSCLQEPFYVGKPQNLIYSRGVKVGGMVFLKVWLVGLLMRFQLTILNIRK